MGAFVPIIAPLVGGVVGLGTTLAMRKSVKTPVAQAAPTRNQAAERAAINDSLARRQGTRANQRTGYGGAEASTGAKTSLLGR